MMQKLVAAGLKINREKCEFFCSKVLYLGYLLDPEGLRLDSERIAPIVNYPAPTTVKQFFGYGRLLCEISEPRFGKSCSINYCVRVKSGSGPRINWSLNEGLKPS